MFVNSSCLFVCLESSYNFTVSGGPNSSLIKVYILEYIFTSSRQSTVRIQSSIVFRIVSHRRSPVVLASRRRSRVACVVKRRLTHGPPSCSLVGDIDTWSRESGQGTHGGRGRRGGRPSPAGNIRVFSLTTTAANSGRSLEAERVRYRKEHRSCSLAPPSHVGKKLAPCAVSSAVAVRLMRRRQPAQIRSDAMTAAVEGRTSAVGRLINSRLAPHGSKNTLRRSRARLPTSVPIRRVRPLEN